MDEINSNPELKTLWEITNVNAIKRLGMTDHGIVHFQIVANMALRIGRILQKKNISYSVVEDFDLSKDHGEVIIMLASLLHDLGMTIEREGHEAFSLFLANNLLRDSLHFLEPREKTIIVSEVLHAIISHRSGGNPLTLEAGIVRVADALDMSEGRSRIPYKSGSMNIHSISATAIDKVNISEGKAKPIHVEIRLNNSAGVFQIDELLKHKISGSGLEKYVEVRAALVGDTEKKLMKEFSM